MVLDEDASLLLLLIDDFRFVLPPVTMDAMDPTTRPPMDLRPAGGEYVSVED